MTDQIQPYVAFSGLLFYGSQERKVDSEAIGKDAVASGPAKGTARDEPAKFDRYLLAETVLAVFAAVLGIKAVSVGPASRVGCFFRPLY